MTTVDLATWDRSARTHVDSIFNLTVLFSTGADWNEQIRKHLDFMIAEYFNNSEKSPSAEEWKTLGRMSVTASGNLNRIDTATTLCNKQRDYGPNNIARFGQSGLLLRLHDKVARLENLLSNGREATNESLHDTYLDIVGYSTIGIMLIDGSFFLPMESFA